MDIHHQRLAGRLHTYIDDWLVAGIVDGTLVHSLGPDSDLCHQALSAPDDSELDLPMRKFTESSPGVCTLESMQSSMFNMTQRILSSSRDFPTFRAIASKRYTESHTVCFLHFSSCRRISDTTRLLLNKLSHTYTDTSTQPSVNFFSMDSAKSMFAKKLVWMSEGVICWLKSPTCSSWYVPVS